MSTYTSMALFTFCRTRFCKSTKSCSRLLSNMQRPVASLDQSVEEDGCPSEKVAKNPGATSRGAVRLPTELRKAVDKIIADQSPAVLMREALKLRHHLDNKKPPLSQEEIESIRAVCENKLNMEKPPPGNKLLSALLPHIYSSLLTLQTQLT